MKADKVKVFLAALGAKQTKVRGDWISASCVLGHWNHGGGVDHNPSFGIKIEAKKKSISHCWSCGWGGDLMDLVMEIAKLQKKNPCGGMNLGKAVELLSDELAEMELDPNSIPEYDEKKENVDHVFSDVWLKSFKPWHEFPEAVAYVVSRNIEGEIADEFDLRYDPQQSRLCFPFRNFKGQLMGLQGRSIEKNPTLRYYQYAYQGKRNGHVWMNEDKIDFDKPVVLVEGPMDLLRVAHHYKNCAASFTSGLSVEKLKRIGDAQDGIITFYDYGAGGNAARAKIKKTMSKYPVQHIIPTEEQDDAGNCTDGELIGYLQKYVPVLKSVELA